MLRRRLLLAQCALLPLAACGFRLRGSTEMAFKSIYINAVEGSLLGNELKRNLVSSGALEVISDANLQQSAQVILDILNEQREKTVVGVNTSGQVREFELRVRLKFRLRTPQAKELIPETELLLRRNISFNESAVLAKEAEEGLMYRDMQTDIVQQMLRRLAAVRTL